MCGRFTITVDKVEFILKKFRAELSPAFTVYQPRYNAAPTQLVPGIVAHDDGKRYLTGIHWSLTPPWAEKEGSKYSAQINIRDETIDTNKFFRSLLLGARCLFVADGFFEWQVPKAGTRKIPYRIHFKDDAIMPIAGLYRVKDELLTGAIITTSPNKLMIPIHNRMPVILNDKAVDLWLDPGCKDFDRLRELLAPASDAKMDAYRVSTAVNNARLDSKLCIKPE